MLKAFGTLSQFPLARLPSNPNAQKQVRHTPPISISSCPAKSITKTGIFNYVLNSFWPIVWGEQFLGPCPRTLLLKGLFRHTQPISTFGQPPKSITKTIIFDYVLTTFWPTVWGTRSLGSALEPLCLFSWLHPWGGLPSNPDA